MKKKSTKIMTGVAGTALLLSGYAGLAPQPKEAETTPVTETQTAEPIHAEYEVNGYQVEADTAEVPVYTKVANVEGDFLFGQDVISPSDEVFNIFGTAVTGLCASPSFTTERAQTEEDHYLNISGNLKKQYTVNLTQTAKESSEKRVLKCSCATGSAVANARVIGVPLSAVIRMDELEEGVNTVTVKGSDGYGMSLPLTYALEKKALIVYQVNDEEIPSGTQFWVPETVARYFTRDVVSIELTAEDEVPEVQGPDAQYRAKVNVLNTSDGCTFHAGQEIVFEGYADDCGSSIAAIEFSMDGGETWTTCSTEGATADKWVFWNFCYTPEEAGTYQLTARAVTADGTVSPLASSLLFTVE